MYNFALKFQAVAEKTAKDARGLFYFAAPGICVSVLEHNCTYVCCIFLFIFILICIMLWLFAANKDVYNVKRCSAVESHILSLRA